MKVLLVAPLVSQLLRRSCCLASTVADRQAEYRQIVVENYNDPLFVEGCDCSACGPEFKGEDGSDIFSGFTSCFESQFTRDFAQSDALLTRENPAPIVFAYENLPIPPFALEGLKCKALLDEGFSTVRDFSLTMIVRTLHLVPANSTAASGIESFLQEQYDLGSLRLWLQKDEKEN